jgi:7-keto-8-aminopelargonate synthetase-like enzyme
MADALDRIAESLAKEPVVRFFRMVEENDPGLLMKDMTLEEVGPDRWVKLDGRWVVNFGSDSSLGLDQDPRVKDALRRGLDRWGTHNGASRAFSSVAANVEAERKLATWLRCESTLIYPSVTLANLGALPALLSRRDALAVDRHAHRSVQEGMKLVRAGGAKTAVFAHNDPSDLDRVLRELRPYRHAVVAVDGVYSMTGTLPPLRDLRRVAESNDAILYVDDAHGTGVLGRQGRGTVLDALGDYRGTLVVGSLSKALSCFGGFLACPARLKFLLALRSSPIVFGGPVPPPYLDAVCDVVDLLDSPAYFPLRKRLSENMELFLSSVRGHGLEVVGGFGAIASVVVGDEVATLQAGRALFERGYYVQSVVFPAVAMHRGVLRVQINANHLPESVRGLGEALAGVLRAKRRTGGRAAAGER